MHKKNKYTAYIAVVVLLIAGLFWLVANVKSNNARPTVKIGLVAPFEGLYRSTGYEVLFAVKVALQERNQGQGINGYRVELVALNDFNDPNEAYRQAQALVADSDIVGVVGHFSPASTVAALPVYQDSQLAIVIPWSVDTAVFNGDFEGVASVAATTDETVARLKDISGEMGYEHLETLTKVQVNMFADNGQAYQLSTDAVTAGNILLALDKTSKPSLFGHVDVGNRQLLEVAGAKANGLVYVSPGPAANDISEHESFVEAYQALAGFPPSPRAILAYDATNVLLDSIEQAMITGNQTWVDNRPGRAEVGTVIPTIQRQGVTGKIAFDVNGRRLDAPVWIYQISEARYPGRLIAP